METELKFVQLLSLKEMALRKVAIILWSDSVILASVSKFTTGWFSESKRGEWKETIEEQIKKKVLKLELPVSLMVQAIDCVQAVGLEIKRWKEIHKIFFWSSPAEIDPTNLYWTSAGTIDDRKTAEEHIRCDVIYILERYKLACYYCLDDYIPLLWEEFSEKMKKYYLNEKRNFVGLEFCWPYILKGEYSKLNYLWIASSRNLTSFNQWAFEHSAQSGNKVAAEFFFKKLTYVEREASLKRTALSVLGKQNVELLLMKKHSDVSCYLLSLMSPDQQMEIVEARPIDVLLCFLDWRRQDLFSANAGLIWTCLPPSAFNDLLEMMVERYRSSDHYFPKLFRQFLKQMPLDFKKYFVDSSSARYYEFGVFPASRLLCNFFDLKDSESVEVLFRNMNAADRVKIIFQETVLRRIREDVDYDKLLMVEVCLREAKLSKEDRERLKETFLGFRWENSKLQRLSEFLEETGVSSDKEKKGQKRKFED